MGKILNQKTSRWFMIGCAGFIALYNLIAVVGADSFGALANVIWIFAAMGLIIYGLLASKENFVKGGLFAALAFVFNAFVDGCSVLGYVGEVFDFSGVLGLAYLFWGLAHLCVVALFVFWILKTFFGIEVNKFVQEIVVYCAVGLYLLSFIFIIIGSIAEEYYDPSFSDVIVFWAYIAYVGLYMAYFYKDEPATSSTKKKAVESKKENADKKEETEKPAESKTEA